MRLYRKLLAVLVLSVALVMVPMQSRAIAPIVAFAGYLLEITGGSILVSDLVAGMTGTIAAVLWYDCNNFGSGGCDSKPSSMPAAQAPGSPEITVKLNPDSKRDNPDPTRFNDPSESARDVTPKQSVSASATGATQSSYGPEHKPTGAAVTAIARDGHVFVMGGNGQFRGIDSTAVLMTVFNSGNWPACRTPGIKCEVRGPFAADENCAYYDIRNVTDGGDSYVASPAVCAWNTAPAPCPVGYATDGSGSCVPVLTQKPVYGCPDGYISSSGGCSLADANAVKKPSDAACELLWDPSANSFSTDPKAPKCNGILSSASMSVQNPDGSSMTVTPNSNGGFDITKTNSNGSSTTVKTGPYQPSSGGYVIIQTVQATNSGQTPDGQGDGCGIPGKPACNVQFSIDAATDAAGVAVQNGVTDGMNSLKGMLDNIDPNKFQWSFIPQIPTATCENPRVKNPLITQYLDVDICGFFNKFSFFLNGVLAVLCLYGCAREVQKTLKA